MTISKTKTNLGPAKANYIAIQRIRGSYKPAVQIAPTRAFAIAGCAIKAQAIVARMRRRNSRLTTEHIISVMGRS